MSVDILGTSCETNAEAWFSIVLHPRKPEGSLGRTAQDGHLDSHTAPELWFGTPCLWPHEQGRHIILQRCTLHHEPTFPDLHWLSAIQHGCVLRSSSSQGKQKQKTCRFINTSTIVSERKKVTHFPHFQTSLLLHTESPLRYGTLRDTWRSDAC